MKKNFLMICISAVLTGLVIGGGAVFAESDTNDLIEELICDMTLQEKIAQMFFITPEQLTGYECVTKAKAVTRAAYEQYPVGGLIYFADNFESEEQTKEMLNDMKKISMDYGGIPIFLGTDEEGGRVTRIYESGIGKVPQMEPMLELGRYKDVDKAYEAGKVLGGYLAEYGCNLNFAPVADIFSNPENKVIGDRALGTDAQSVCELLPGVVKGMEEMGIKTVLKHFPGHGDTVQDSHKEPAVLTKSLEELRSSEFLPFRAGIDAGSEIVMMGHISVPSILEGDEPASLSETMIQQILREEIGFEGIIITDAMNMKAISEYYNPQEACVMAIQAGADMILMPDDFLKAYMGVLEAVAKEELSEERINESMYRILKVKFKLLNNV